MSEVTGEAVLRNVREQVEECSHDDKGRWLTCTGCHESEDGHDVGYYPFSPDFGCKLGGGCSECGGIGAIWDTTDWAEAARWWMSADGRDMVAGDLFAGAPHTWPEDARSGEDTACQRCGVRLHSLFSDGDCTAFRTWHA
jgi:hypothetical protein